MPMGCVLAETYVDAEHEGGEELGEEVEGENDRCLGRVGGASSRILIPSILSFDDWTRTHLLHLHWDAKENHPLQPLFYQRSQEPLKLVDSPSLLSGQGRNNLLAIGIVGDEDRVDEHRLGEGSS